VEGTEDVKPTAAGALPTGAPNSTAPAPERLADFRNKSESDAGIVEWNDKLVKLHGSPRDGLTLSPLWLRDSCPCHQCVDPDSGQKNFSTTDLAEPRIEHAELTSDGSLKIVWAADPPSGGKSHTSVFPAGEVAGWRKNRSWQRLRPVEPSPHVSINWDRAEYEALLAQGRCRVSYKDWINDDTAFWKAFADLRMTGLIFVTDVPSDEAEVERIAGRIGPLQHTFYGLTWDVKSKPQAENVAYTSKFLGLHQDLLYHDPIPGLQLLHCLANTCEGGESLFSNGVRAAYDLKAKYPDYFDILKKARCWFGYRKGDNHYFRGRRTIHTTPTGQVIQTNWAPPFQTTFPLPARPEANNILEKWKRAATAFQEIAESESNIVELKLKEGECVIFDNRQILHGRRQFAAGEGSRWLKGAYITQQTYQGTATRLLDPMRAAGIEVPESVFHE
jgi:alpha-ketoglutarate-dependent taurine dioxygenase